MKKSCISHQTKIEELGDNIEGQIICICPLLFKLNKLLWIKVTDQSDTAQLVIFIRRIDKNVNIIE